jgi:hypothetical protein
MFDPLNNATHNPFAQTSPTAPSWPTTPHSPLSQAIMPKPSSPRPQTPEKQPQMPTNTNPYGREPQIYGQPGAGLISPQANAGTNGQKFEKNEPYLRVRITSLDRNRRDVLVRLDAQVLHLFNKIFILSYFSVVDKLIKLYWNNLPQCLKIIRRVPAVRRANHIQ